MAEYLDARDLPFTYDELYAALRATCRHEADARASAAEYAAIAAERRTARAAGDDPAPDPTLLPVEVLAALALASADAAARVARLRAAQLPAGASAAFRAEANRFWHETLAAVRGRIDRRGDPPAA